MIGRLWKPWFVYNPPQLFGRFLASARPNTPGYQPLSTAWGVPVLADPVKNVGWSIKTTGVFDLAVSEVLSRLVDPGDVVIDGGANVGYMSLLLSVTAGRHGTLLSFEPHPELFGILERNIATLRRDLPGARFELHQAALGETNGTAQLVVPSEFATNDGLCHLAEDSVSPGATIPVDVETIDACLGARQAKVMKLDVEGYELPALRGTARALSDHRIRHIVFEDHVGGNSDVVCYLRSAGYQVFALGWSMRGPILAPVVEGRLASEYEAPSYIASIAPDEAIARMRPRGWRVLSRSASRGMRRMSARGVA